MNGKFGRKKFRDAWVAVHVKRGVATQLRSLRGTSSQASFGKKLDKPQSVVARLEDPSYGAMTVQTLLDIASKLDIGLLVKFVPFSRVLRETKNITSDDLAPLSYEAEVKAQRAIPVAYITANVSGSVYMGQQPRPLRSDQVTSAQKA